MNLSKCRAHLKGPPGSSNPLLSHCLYVSDSEIYLSKQLTMTTQWQAIDTKAKSLCYFLDESFWSIWQEAPSSHIASMDWIAGSHGLVSTKSIGKVKHEKMFLGWIETQTEQKCLQAILAVFSSTQTNWKYKGEGSWTNFCDWSFWLV